jgi:DMSO reductase anchor subunit
VSALQIASLSFFTIVAGAAVGMLVGRHLPEHHLETNSKDAVRLAMAMIATMTALVLGLVTGSAKSTFDADDAAVKHTAAAVLALDRTLADYGSETQPIRTALKATMTEKVDSIWSNEGALERAGVRGASGGEKLLGAVLALTPANDAQRWYQARALGLASDILQTRWLVFSGSDRSVPSVFLTVIVCWLTVLFGSFALFAPRNATVVGSLLVCALSVSASIFLILEMDDPFSGVMRISDVPIRYALAQMGQ